MISVAPLSAVKSSIAHDIDPDSAGAFVIGGIRHGIAQQLRVTPLPDPGIVTARLWRLISAALGVA